MCRRKGRGISSLVSHTETPVIDPKKDISKMKNKWSRSQELEREWWLQWKERIDMDDIREDLIGRARRISETIDRVLPGDRRLKILQIGPAANGEIHYLVGKRYAIDPLAPFFISNFPDLMDSEVDYIEGVGERLPYPDLFFDVILNMNVLDHCLNPSLVVREMERCLARGGALILIVCIYSPLTTAGHSAFAFLDKEHPHALTSRYLKKELAGGFDIIEESFQSVPLPDYNPIKTFVLGFLRTLRLSPTFLHLTLVRKQLTESTDNPNQHY